MSKHFEMTIKISRSRIADLLCTALEGGTGYWATILDFKTPPQDADLFTFWNEDDSATLKDDDGKPTLFRHIHYPMCKEGGGLLIGDTDARDPFSDEAAFEPKLLDWKAIQRGLVIMAEKYPQHFGNFLAENDDADTGDCLVQCALFGEEIFA